MNIPNHLPREKATFVLVHGGGHGGWAYQCVARLLRAKGHEVHTPTLTGVGERAHLLTADVSLHTHIQDIVNVLEYEDLHDVILAGHSYGGAVVTGVADRAGARVGQLVFLDASILSNGESIADASPGIRSFAESDCRRVNGIELILWPQNPSTRALYGIINEADWTWMKSRLTPHPWRTFNDRLDLRNPEAVASLPRTIINCPGTMATRPQEEHHRHTTADRVWEIDTGHDLMITEPEQTAAMLLRLAEIN